MWHPRKGQPPWRLIKPREVERLRDDGLHHHPAIDVPIDFPALTYTFTTAIWRDWGHGELFFPTCPCTFLLSYTTARPILFCTCKSIRTRCLWHDALLHHLPFTFSIIINNEITTYKKKSVSLRAGSSSRLDDDTSPLVTPTTRPATRSRAQNISPEYDPSHHRDFFTASRRCSRCREVIKSPRSSVCL